ncbi:M14 family zinc carboxypeptidase [Riemerella columbina]|uniref:M14 family zinc carboxypeptidase n=1 Tax=Riemerella columbina TaxID=103810 RepID=UPI000363CB25|nr:M14 family zinc carboxypeptidase [Riemerella columbina]
MEFQYVRNVNFNHRYISPQQLHHYLESHYAQQIKLLGTSTLGLPIYSLRIGTGKTKVAAWSQMHGNESTATLALLDLLYSWNSNQVIMDALFSEIQLDFIVMLNPDGSKVWTRRNSLDIDINRDFIKESSKEIKILKQFVASNHYDYALNLHDQRTIFTTDGEHPATLSFLSPSENVARSLTEHRKQSMAVIASIYKALKSKLPHRIGRYSDEFYPLSVGDNFMKMGLPTVLFEGGHYENDYYRNHTRQYYTEALYIALKAMADLKGDTTNFEMYSEIPENKDTHCDIIYNNLNINTGEEPYLVDVAVQYREEFTEGHEELTFQPYILDIGDARRKKAWKTIDCEGKLFQDKRPQLDQKAQFTIG